MKKLALMAMAVLTMVACQNNENAYTINGTLQPAGENDSVSMSLIKGRRLVELQKVPVVGGKFKFEGTADSIQVVALSMGDAFCQLFLEPGEIKVDLKQGEMSFALGTPNNNAYEAFSTDIKALEDEYTEIARNSQNPELTDAQRKEIKEQMSTFEEKYFQAIKSCITENAGNDFGLYILGNYYSMFDSEELAPILESYIEAFPTNELRDGRRRWQHAQHRRVRFSQQGDPDRLLGKLVWSLPCRDACRKGGLRGLQEQGIRHRGRIARQQQGGLDRRHQEPRPQLGTPL